MPSEQDAAGGSSLIELVKRCFKGQAPNPQMLRNEPSRLAYFRVLKGIFQSSPPPVDDVGKAAFATLTAIANSDESTLRRSDLYEFEALLPYVEPKNLLARSLFAIRERFRVMVGKEAFDRYLATKPPDETSPEAELRADAVSLMLQIHRSNINKPGRERIRTGLLQRVLLVALSLVFLIVVTIVVQENRCEDCDLPIQRLVAIAGIAGGFVSVQRRIQAIPDAEVAQLTEGRLSVLLVPLLSAVFALVLYQLFVAHLLTGELFPKIPLEGKDAIRACPTCGPYWIPTNINLAKLLVWSFVAGFGERFVPDTLDRLIARQAEGNSSPR